MVHKNLNKEKYCYNKVKRFAVILKNRIFGKRNKQLKKEIMRTSKKINKVVKVVDNEITVLNEAFAYADGFKGLTGSVFQAVSKREFDTELLFDTSYSDMWDYLREELNLSEDEAYIFNCIGGGRCFRADDKFTHNRELEKYLVYEQK